MMIKVIPCVGSAATDDSSPKAAAAGPVGTGGPGKSWSLIRRQAIVDTHRRIAGYALSLCPRYWDAGCGGNLDASMERADLRGLLERRLVFVPLCAGCFKPDFVSTLPRGQVAIGINVAAGDDARTLADAARALRAAGFPVFLDDYRAGSHADALLSCVDYARVDVRDGVAGRVADIAAIRAAGVLPVALNLADDAQFEAARAAGCALMQGEHYRNPTRATDPKVLVQRAHVVELLNLSRSEADIADIEAVLRRDPMLTYHMLRYVNSPGGGLAQPVSSIRHALMVLGYKPLYRWFALLLYAAGDADERGRSLLLQALARGHLAETLGKTRLAAGERDGLYLVGMFSLLDVLLGKPMEQALAGISLPASVRDALLTHQGPLAPYLDLALACESSDAVVALTAAQAAAIPTDEINAAHLDALMWSERVEP